MGETSIEWTAGEDGTPGKTWNPARGCTKVSPGCKNCYAETFAERWRGVKGHPYEHGFDVRLVPEKLAEPLKWKKPRRVFVNSMSDLFHEGVPDEYIAAVFGVMAAAPQHTFQVLTKRAARLPAWFKWVASKHGMGKPTHTCVMAAEDIMRDWTDGKTSWSAPWPLRNVWLGVSVEDQERANERIPWLLGTPAAVRFVSAEPLLGPVSFDRIALPGFPRDVCDALRRDSYRGGLSSNRIDWVIVGGESGNKARPFDLAWAGSIVEQCKSAGTACFVKQLGARPTYEFGEPVKLASRKGGDMDEWPEWLRVREWPASSAPDWSKEAVATQEGAP